MNQRLVRVNSWEEFKKIVKQANPDTLVYNVESAGISKVKEFTSLRLILSVEKCYVYIDFPKGDKLRETGIIIRKDPNGTRYLDDEDIKAFLKKEFGEKIAIYSYWVT